MKSSYLFPFETHKAIKIWFDATHSTSLIIGKVPWGRRFDREPFCRRVGRGVVFFILSPSLTSIERETFVSILLVNRSSTKAPIICVLDRSNVKCLGLFFGGCITFVVCAEGLGVVA